MEEADQPKRPEETKTSTAAGRISDQLNIRKRRPPTVEPPAGCILCSRFLTFMNCHCAGVGF